MKIGILTQPLLYNYGGILQNYALQKVLIDMGHEVETIDWRSKKTNFVKNWLWETKQYILWKLGLLSKRPRYKLTREEESYILKETNSFIGKYINRCPELVNNSVTFESIPDKFSYEGYIVGSDQVWRPRYSGGHIENMFLKFVAEKPNTKRIAYAASFGTENWEFNKKQTEVCSRLSKKFNLISVREKSGIDLCKKHLGVDAVHVIDPTLLLLKEDYEKIVEAENEQRHQGTLFYYILDPSEKKRSFVNKVAQDLGLTPFTVLPRKQTEERTKYDVKNNIDDCVYPSVTSWLRAFIDAELILVDSFHGAVFSIIFNKPFWVMRNDHRGNTRFISLLETFHLEDRLINIGGQKLKSYNINIDWQRVNAVWNNKRSECINLLRSHLI